MGSCSSTIETVNETQAPASNLEPLIPQTNKSSLSETPLEEEQPTIISEEESSLMIFAIYYVLVPILLLAMFGAETFYYQSEKDNNIQLLKLRIWLKKNTKILKLKIRLGYHKMYFNLMNGKRK